MVLSKLAKKVYLGHGQYAVFNNILFEPVELSRQEMLSLWRGQFQIFSKKNLSVLKKKGILVETRKQDKQAIDSLVHTVNSAAGTITLMYLIPSGECNLACKYCFIGKIKPCPTNYMSKDTVSNAIHKFSAYLEHNHIKEGNILFYGGEPTMNFDLIKYAVKLTQKLPVRFNFTMITNGTLLSDDRLDFIKDNKIHLSVSLDGPKEITDGSRVFKEGAISVYDKVVDLISRMKQKGIKFGLSITLAKDIRPDKAFLDWLFKLNVHGVGFNPLIFSNPNENWRKYYQNIGKHLFYLHDQISKTDMTDERLDRKYTAFESATFKYNDCPSRGGEQFVVCPSGDVVICHGYWNNPQEEICGNINKNSIEDIQQTCIYQKWKANLTVNKKKCLRCAAIKICGGGCALQSDRLFGDQQKIDIANCLYTKYALKELLKRAFS